MQFIALLSKEQGLTCNFMLKGSLLVIYNKHPFVLVILIIINIRMQLLIKVLVYDFRLSIYLRVVRGR
jgi:hypothetical protein